MNAVVFASAYRQLRPSEKAFVVGYIDALEKEYDRRGERLSNALHRPIDADTVAQSRGMLEKPMVIAAISERILQIAQDSELSPQKVLRGLMTLYNTSLANFQTIGEDGMPYYDFSLATPEQLWAIQHLKYKPAGPRGPGELEIKLPDRIRISELLLKIMGVLDGDGEFYRRETARPVNATIQAGGDAADAYAKLRDLR